MPLVFVFMFSEARINPLGSGRMIAMVKQQIAAVAKSAKLYWFLAADTRRECEIIVNELSKS